MGCTSTFHASNLSYAEFFHENIFFSYFMSEKFLIECIAMVTSLLSRAAAQATAGASGASAKKKVAPKREKEFAGDILLKFRHLPKVAESGKCLKVMLCKLK